MPHYADGERALPGQIVRGKGYNLRDDVGELREFVGLLLSVNENAQVCNVTILVPEEGGGFLHHTVDGIVKSGAIVYGKVEYGQADHFLRLS